MKKLGAVVAAVVMISGCGGGQPAVPADSSTTAVREIATWQEWGQSGQELLSRCDPEGWGCIHDQVVTLIASAKKLDWVRGKTPPEEILGFYEEAYQRYGLVNCDVANPSRETAVKCAVGSKQLPTTADAVRGLVDNLASGQ